MTTQISKDLIQAAVEEILNNSPQTAKAWVNFDGSGTVAIRDSYNVSSITDNGTGDYTVNFTNNMANTNYVSVGTSSYGNVGAEQLASVVSISNLATSSYLIRTYNPANNIPDDAINIYSAVFGESA